MFLLKAASDIYRLPIFRHPHLTPFPLLSVFEIIHLTPKSWHWTWWLRRPLNSPHADGQPPTCLRLPCSIRGHLTPPPYLEEFLSNFWRPFLLLHTFLSTSSDTFNWNESETTSTWTATLNVLASFWYRVYILQWHVWWGISPRGKHGWHYPHARHITATTLTLSNASPPDTKLRAQSCWMYVSGNMHSWTQTAGIRKTAQLTDETMATEHLRN